jgi:energy-coupling factor transporter transmembrane protein EcfT
MVNSYDRAERVYQSMVMRGYSGSIPVEAGGQGLSQADIRALALTIAGLVVALALGWLL